jgi:hypothetical protein
MSEKSGAPRFSLLIHSPSEDLNSIPEYSDYAQFHAQIACHSINGFREICYIPDHVLDFLENCEERGSHRVEILDGTVSYKLYIKPKNE